MHPPSGGPIGLQAIIMDFGSPKAGDTFASSTSPLPASKLNIIDATYVWLQFWTGKLSVAKMFNPLNTKCSAMVLLARHQGPLQLMSVWFQMCVVAMIAQSYLCQSKADN